MYTCALSTKTFRSLSAPSDSDNLATTGLRRYYAVVPLSEIPNDWTSWLEINARDSSSKGRVPAAIRSTLADKPEWFSAYNRGLTLVASAIQYDNKGNRLAISFNDREYHGILDGGHTLQAILDARDLLDGDQQEGFCNVEIFTGLDESEIPGVVEARNTSKQVTSKSLLNLEGSFDDLKRAIGSKGKIIIWKENEEGTFDVRELIGILYALDPSTISEGTQPISAYSGKEACLKRFRDRPDLFKKLYPIAGDALEMWDAIQYYLPKQYNERFGGRFGGLTGVQENTKRHKELPFIGKTTKYYIPTGYIYPVISSFRAMLVDKGGEWAWDESVNPMELIEKGSAADIFQASVRESIGNDRNPNRTGKNAQTWLTAFLFAQNRHLREITNRAMQQK